MKKKQIIITAAVAVVVGAASFYGGILYGKASGASSRLGNLSAAQRGQFLSGASGNAGTPRGGQFGQGGGILSGSVTAKDNQSITIKTTDGSSHIVFYSTSTSIIKPSPASVNDVTNGSSVMVVGTANSDGSLTAQSIQIREQQQQGQR